MLYVIFHLGEERYALPATHVAEVLPLVEIRRVPQAPRGVAGVFNRRGALVPLLDMNEIVLGSPARQWLSSRILLVKDPVEGQHCGLLVERATETIRRDPAQFLTSSVESPTAPFLGPISTDESGMVQRIELDRLLSPQLRSQLFGTAWEAT